MTEKSIARKVYDLSDGADAIVLPKGVTGKFFTIYFEERPYKNAMVFSDGSELIIEDGAIYFCDNGFWHKGTRPGFEVPFFLPENPQSVKNRLGSMIGKISQYIRREG